MTVSPISLSLPASAPASTAPAAALPASAEPPRTPAAGPAQPARADSQEAAASVAAAVQDINKQLQAWATELHFDMDPDLHRIVISLRDSESGEVLRTIPTDAAIRYAKMIVKLQGNTVETTA
ncbi:flagellar protein FlaG [Bordetella genomosp. 12]|uniref:Flagellar protein n=1 Tax=Bordetella genomosp. 12 TaxID=463035 RepID=A0A261VMA0_9BORD|nr:flagellar protein FlaG [Bordetella genomosp. 12]OZI74700.1 hypothetical protein CAL22_09615 [Bordetella genomosp. 12]